MSMPLPSKNLSANRVSRHLEDLPEVDSDTILNQFNRLMNELLRGKLVRNTFRPWEIEILLDIQTCDLRDGQKRETLRRYQRAVQRQMEKGAKEPMKLSAYLTANRAKRLASETPATLS
ncbi:MAG TPA: hypothetical protein VFQ91_04100 [Bryobacteraceae bacterium]|nr:hypothetical protein [Bryobacteraceae bacterium]